MVERTPHGSEGSDVFDLSGAEALDSNHSCSGWGVLSTLHTMSEVGARCLEVPRESYTEHHGRSGAKRSSVV